MRTNTVLTLVIVLHTGLARAEVPSPKPAVIGHRGMLQAAPENTLAGFRACLSLRVGFEFDVRRTKDGKLVCLHDETVDRTTNRIGKLATSWTLMDLRGLDVGSKFAFEFRGERVPTIDEILDLIAESKPGSGLIAVDLKEAGDGIEAAIVKAAAERKVLDRLVFIGLTIESAEVRGRLKSASREAQTARLAGNEASIAGALADKDADWVYLRFLPGAEARAQIRTAGKPVFIAGPLVAGHEPQNWSRAAELEIRAILTDYPLELAKQLRGANR